MISGKSRVYGIIGNPVEHSMSPLMQNFYGKKTGIDLAYVPLKVEEGRIGDAIRGACALNFIGMNVTVPYKQAVMEYLEEIDEDARAIGAVNTLVRGEHGYKGYNTDAAGLLRAMKGRGIPIAGKPCLLIGAGGAAKAAAYVLAKEGTPVIYVLNRSRDKAENLAALINKGFSREVMKPMALSDYKTLPPDRYLAVQTTSLGMYPGVDETPVGDPAFYENIETAVEIIYNPPETKFMNMVRAAGGKVLGGLDMLIYQGVIAYELWNPGVSLSEEIIEEARVLLAGQPGEDR